MKKWLPILLILWLAFGLRVYGLTAVPPGLTHDEANHGREAIGILDGILLYYFPLNYGSEPLYSYTSAGSMGLLGENLFALRYVNVIFSLLAIAATYAWAKCAFDERVALITAVLLATAFWPLASSRQALRAGMLPFFMALAVWAFWQMVKGRRVKNEEQPSRPSPLASLPSPLLLALLLATTFHIYLAARVVWLIFPAFVIYLTIVNRAQFRQLWWPTLLGLLLTAVLVTPMFIYLQNHPEAQTRLGMFDDPLAQFKLDQIAQTASRAGRAFLAFFYPGYGDQFLAYNIPGRPVFDAITGIFFLVGLLVTIKFTIYDLRFTIGRPSPLAPRPSLHSAHTFLLLWFLIGIIPSLMTGPTANTTRNLAALSAVHILPALGFVTILNKVESWYKPYALRLSPLASPLSTTLLAFLWLTFTLFTTSRDYFVRWGQSPEVRSAYQHTLIEELAYLQEKPPDTAVIISTVYPGPAHDSSIAMLMAAERETRWIDARLGLIVPNGRSPQTAIIPHSTPPHPLFAQWLQASDTITLRPDDLDPNFTVYNLDTTQLQSWLDETSLDINFNDAITLRHARWLAATTPPGGVAELLTIWQVSDPTLIGPRVPPADATDAKLFTHVLANDSTIMAQQDLLSVPSWQWQSGDIILQVHQIWIAPEIESGVYETAVGLYSEATGQRVPILDSTDNRAFVTSLQIAP